MLLASRMRPVMKDVGGCFEGRCRWVPPCQPLTLLWAVLAPTAVQSSQLTINPEVPGSSGVTAVAEVTQAAEVTQGGSSSGGYGGGGSRGGSRRLRRRLSRGSGRRL